MGDEQSLRTATDTRTAIVRFTLAVPPVLLCFGFLCSIVMGCNAPQALLKATAYTLSGLGGWLVYLLIRRPSDSLFAPALLVGMNVQVLNPTRTPWPFAQMLAHGLIVSILCISIVVLGGRLLGRGKNLRPGGVHPLSDAELDQPLSGRSRSGTSLP